MRNFRKAALAGATAVAVAFGSTAVATAEEHTGADKGTENVTVQEKPTEGDGSLSSRIGARLEKDQTAYGPALFGSSKGEAEGEKETYDQQPAWAKAFHAISIFTAVSALVGLIVGPAYNFVVHGPFNF